jgi:hypothetical protein
MEVLNLKRSNTTSNYGHAVGMHTLKVTELLASFIIKFFELKKCGGMPCCHEFVPKAFCWWNNVKGGQDAVSRILKNSKVDMRSLSPRGFIWMRLVNICLLNTHCIYRLIA